MRVKKMFRLLAKKTDDVKKDSPIHKNSEKGAETKTLSKADKQRAKLEKLRKEYDGFDRDHIWAFCSGQSSQDFRGNPKYLFIYINNYRPDIKAYWFCSDPDTIKQVTDLGYQAYNTASSFAQYVFNRTGVIVAEQVKHNIPKGFYNVKYLNLWHGVGFKTCERRLFLGDISMPLAKKYIYIGTFYRDNQLMNATCPLVEDEITKDCGVDEDKIIRTGYPRCLYQQNFKPVQSFDPDLRKIKGLPEDTRLAVYAPTYRAKLGGTFARAITDFEKLYKVCEENRILMIFKVHPNMEKEPGFLSAWKKMGDRPYFWFWDNRDDFYEIMHMMDLAIVDYSAITSDMIAMGIKHYIRYLFDYDEYMNSVSVHEDNYQDITTGYIARDFEELLSAIADFDTRDETDEIERINNLLWKYSKGKEDFDIIIRRVMDFVPQKRKFQTLYSFDVFDTLFTRTYLEPEGIYYEVQEMIQENGSFPKIFMFNYPQIRQYAESAVREYLSKTTVLRESERVEIYFEEIFEYIENVYNLSQQQTELLMEWEKEAEYNSILPLPKQIDLVKSLCANNETVILVSDMYHSEEFISKLLEKADPFLLQLPLFVSSTYGVKKTSQQLFFEIYKTFQPFYDFEKWIHYGDNENADVRQPRRFEIKTRRVNRPSFNHYGEELVSFLPVSDAYKVAAMQARLCEDVYSDLDKFIVSYVALVFVPYVDWALRDALKRGYEKLYFISRDGYHLKRIADAIIKQKQYPLETQLIYASRRTWRVPSFIHEVDPGFWEPYGSFLDIISKDKLYKAMELDEKTFDEIFPQVDVNSINFLDKNEMKQNVEIFKNSEKYRQYLLNKAAEGRTLVSAYLKQEIDATKKIAFVEFFGRGYTQDCFLSLWRDVIKDDTATADFYYSRSTLPSANGAIRYHFTANNTKQYFVEAIFANMPYKSIEEYYVDQGTIKPVINPIPYNHELYDAMNRILPEFATRYAALDLRDPEDTDRMLFDFVFYFYKTQLSDKAFAEKIGSLVDSIGMYGTKRQFAPPYTMELLDQFDSQELVRNKFNVTSSVTMSYVRAEPDVQERYNEMYQILPGDEPSAGRFLLPAERKQNRSYMRKYQAVKAAAEEFYANYSNAIQENEIEKRVVVVSDGQEDALLEGIVDRINEAGSYAAQMVTIEKVAGQNYGELAELFSKAEYILINKITPLFCRTSFRPETKLIYLPKNAVRLYDSGQLKQFVLKWRTKYEQLLSNNNISCMQIPSLEWKDYFIRCYSADHLPEAFITGAYRTDLYFDEAYKIAAEEKLARIFPAAKNKKRILYLPTCRLRNETTLWMDVLDLEILKESLGDEYVVIANLNLSDVKDYINPLEIENFSIVVQEKLSIRELAVVSDIIVGDYRDSFFESALLRKPMFSTAYNYENIIRSDNMKINSARFDRFIFCPIIESSYELCEQIKTIENYDFEKMDRFCKTMLNGCDGHSVDRLLEYIHGRNDNG